MKPLSLDELIRCLRKLGFKGPRPGTGPHPMFMTRKGTEIQLPNKHKVKDIRDPLLSRLRKLWGLEEECRSA